MREGREGEKNCGMGEKQLKGVRLGETEGRFEGERKRRRQKLICVVPINKFL